MRMSDNRRSPRSDVIDVTLVVGIPEVRAFGTRDETRRTADRAKRADRRVDAARRAFFCARANNVSLLEVIWKTKKNAVY